MKAGGEKRTDTRTGVPVKRVGSMVALPRGGGGEVEVDGLEVAADGSVGVDRLVGATAGSLEGDLSRVWQTCLGDADDNELVVPEVR